jgi:hypothetical protein
MAQATCQASKTATSKHASASARFSQLNAARPSQGMRPSKGLGSSPLALARASAEASALRGIDSLDTVERFESDGDPICQPSGNIPHAPAAFHDVTLDRRQETFFTTGVTAPYQRVPSSRGEATARHTIAVPRSRFDPLPTGDNWQRSSQSPPERFSTSYTKEVAWLKVPSNSICALAT